LSIGKKRIETIRKTRKRNVFEGVAVDCVGDRKVLIVSLPFLMINARPDVLLGLHVTAMPLLGSMSLNRRLNYQPVFGQKPTHVAIEWNDVIVERMSGS
jgi:hypothetical protein